MKVIGIVLVAIGISLCLIVALAYFKEKSELISPIPNNNGVRVIIITPKP